ncbi:hypothetical protein D3C84_406200 [compost metagenome]
MSACSIARSSTIVESSISEMGASARAMNPSTCMASESLVISRQADAYTDSMSPSNSIPPASKFARSCSLAPSSAWIKYRVARGCPWLSSFRRLRETEGLRPSASAIRATASRPSGCIATIRSGFAACSCTAGFKCARSRRWVPNTNMTPLGTAAGSGNSANNECAGLSSLGTWSSPSTTIIVRTPSRS